MAAISDIVAQLASYRGFIGWNGFTDGAGNVRPPVRIELFIKDHPLPMRKPKFTEVMSISQIDPRSNLDTAFKGIFFGAPDILQVAFSGWIISPVSNNQWALKDANGTTLNYGNISYTEVISRYLAGEYNLTVSGAARRKDPDYYITPYGQQYDKPVIAIWDPQYSSVRQKQPFTMTLYLEK
jgi:hypothetical protein